MTTVDVSDLSDFADELRRAARDIEPGIRGVVNRAGLNVKRDAQANLRAQLSGRATSIPRLAAAITYDVSPVDDGFEVEVGPDQAISGLGVGVEFGSRNHAPMPFLVPAFDAEGPRVEDAADKLVTAAFRKAFRG